MKEEILHLKIKYEWKSVYDVHKSIDKLCKNKGINPIEANAITMTATELMENAVKYGKSLPGYQDIDFRITKDDKRIIQIIVTNGVSSEDNFTKLLKHIKQLHETTDSEKLYTENIRELFNNPDCESVQLGLFRIAYEGSFKIDCKYENQLLTIIARRHLLDDYT